MPKRYWQITIKIHNILAFELIAGSPFGNGKEHHILGSAFPEALLVPENENFRGGSSTAEKS